MTKAMKIYLNRKWTILACIVFSVLAFSQGAAAESTGKRTVEYMIEIDSYDLGVSTAIWTRPDKETVKLRLKESFSIPGYTYSADTNLLWLKGRLNSFTLLENDGGDQTTIIGKTEGNTINMTSENANEKKIIGSLALDSFDLIYEALPIYLAQREYPEALALKVFDMASGDTLDGSIKTVGKDRITYQNKHFDCTKVRFKSSDVMATLWIAHDEFGPFIVKETSESELGSVVLEMTEYSLTEPKAE